MVKENKLIFTFDAIKKARFGVLPRYAKDDLLIQWFELPNCFIFHNANAREEGDELVLITCRLENPDLDMRKLSESAVDFPRVNESYTSRMFLSFTNSPIEDHDPHLENIFRNTNSQRGLRYILLNIRCPLQVGSTACGYYVMKYMREIVNRGSIVILDSWEDETRIEDKTYAGLGEKEIQSLNIDVTESTPINNEITFSQLYDVVEHAGTPIVLVVMGHARHSRSHHCHAVY
uniref:carotenoid 9,10-dioxygenase n=1 Tax=Cucumis melo TaxID=3656 RepID=A0A9I9ED51_CUCME